MAEEWGPWIEHDGGPCPVPASCIVAIRIRNPSLWLDGDIVPNGNPDRDQACVWEWGGGFDDSIVQYRTYRPDALRNLIDLAEQVEDLTPETVKALVGV